MYMKLLLKKLLHRLQKKKERKKYSNQLNISN